MRTKIINATDYPPPPPLQPKKNTQKMIVVAFLIVIVVVSAVALAYIATGGFGANNPSTSPSASPSGSATASPSTSSSASATQTPSPTGSPTATSSSQSYVSFKDGAWANYKLVTYSEDLSYESQIKERIDEETYNGILCWLMTSTTESTIEGETTTTATKIWMSKNSLQGIHMRMEINGVVWMDEDLNETSTTETGTTGEIDPNTIMSYETITVTAGTFTNCAKASTTTTMDSQTNVSYMWAHQDVPIFGLVKMETYVNQELSSLMELTGYGS